ncbi:MAG: hypothetical protein AAB525_04000, partial [Patescibacteria group bacterium]
MLHYFKKSITYLTVIATILWAMGAPMLPLSIPAPEAKAASATAQFQGMCTGGMGDACVSTQPMFMIPWNGSILPASSQPASLFSFKLKRTAAVTLTSVKVNLVGTASAGDIASIALYRRTDFMGGGMGYTFPSGDRIGNQTTINAFS